MLYSYIDFLFEVIATNDTDKIKPFDGDDRRCCTNDINCGCISINNNQSTNLWPSKEELSRSFSVWRMEGELSTTKM